MQKHNIFMKHNLLLPVLTALAVAACTKGAMEGTVPITLSASMEVPADEATKASISDEGAFTWNPGDQIAVHTTQGKLAVLTATISSDAATTVFSGTLTEGDSVEDGAVAYYPASVAVTGSPEQVRLPATYDSAADAAKGFPMRATVSNGTVAFKHLGGLLRITAKGIPAGVNRLELLIPQYVTGKFTVSGSGADASINAGSNYSTIVINSSASERKGGTAELSIPLPVCTLEGFTLFFKSGNETLFSKSAGSTISITRRKLVKMAPFTLDTGECTQCIVGKFNDWKTSAGARLYPVNGHPGWYVAQNVHLTGANTSGFKFNKITDADDDWGENYGHDGNVHRIQKVQSLVLGGSGNNIKLDVEEGDFDIYLHKGEEAFDKYLVLNAGDPWERQIYVLDCNANGMSFDRVGSYTYFLHAWINGASDADVDSWKNKVCDGFASFGGFKYLVFNFSPDSFYLPDAPLYMMFVRLDGADNTNTQFQDRNNTLVITPGTDAYYVYGHASDAITVFSSPYAAPLSGASSYSLAGTMQGWDPAANPLTWDGPFLVSAGWELSGEIQFKFPYNGAWDNAYGLTTGEVYGPSEAIPVTSPRTREDDTPISNVKVTLDDSPATYDIILSIFTHEAWVMPSGSRPTL